MLSGKKSKRSEIDRGLIILWLSRDGPLSIEQIFERMNSFNRHPSNVSAIGQLLKPLVSKNLIHRASKPPNPIYSISRD